MQSMDQVFLSLSLSLECTKGSADTESCPLKGMNSTPNPFWPGQARPQGKYAFFPTDRLSDVHASHVFMFCCVHGIPFEICQTVNVLPQAVKCGWTQISLDRRFDHAIRSVRVNFSLHSYFTKLFSRMAKRKRDGVEEPVEIPNGKRKRQETSDTDSKRPTDPNIHVQIITGSYERVLHGMIASIPLGFLKSDDTSTPKTALSFSDTFLFHAHASSIRCLALTPSSTESSKITLATGSSDARINLYSISTAPPPPPPKHSPSPTLLPSLTGTRVLQNPSNKELGNLSHHAGTITKLDFPTRGKLLSASTDNTIAITRARDWTVLSLIKAPIPSQRNRPSGDTAAPGEVPAGINDFAVHPSLKVMISVGRGERCMRLWNLVTGKKAGVLQFERSLLEAVGEGKTGSGEGRCVRWDQEGEEFVVGFERGVAVFGMDCKVRGVCVVPEKRTKVCQVVYVPESLETERTGKGNVVAVSTEDGRVLFYETSKSGENNGESSNQSSATNIDTTKEERLRHCRILAQLGGSGAGISGRIKDFEILPLSPFLESGASNTDSSNETTALPQLLVTGSSDGAIRIFSLSSHDLEHSPDAPVSNRSKRENDATPAIKQVGTLIGTHETGNRITCLRAFIMSGAADNSGNEVKEYEANSDDEAEDSSDNSSEDSD